MQVGDPGQRYFPIRPVGLVDMHTEGEQPPYMQDFRDLSSRTHCARIRREREMI